MAISLFAILRTLLKPFVLLRIGSSMSPENGLSEPLKKSLMLWMTVRSFLRCRTLIMILLNRIRRLVSLAFVKMVVLFSVRVILKIRRSSMKRSKVSFRTSKRIFKKTASKSHPINSTPTVSRGGIRL